MLRINLGTNPGTDDNWWPNTVSPIGEYSTSQALKSGTVSSYRPPALPDPGVTLPGIYSISNATANALTVKVDEYVSANAFHNGYTAMTGTNAPIGISLPDAATDFNYKLHNVTRGTQYTYADSLFDSDDDGGRSGQQRYLTESGLPSSTTYSYRWYVGNIAYPYYRQVGGTVSATTKTTAVRTTKTWNCAWSDSYSQSGTKRNTSYLYHDKYDSTWGYQKGVFGFNIGSQIPSNATIHSVKLYLNAAHWYYNSGGYTLVSLASQTATGEPSSVGTPTTLVAQTITWNSKTGGIWLNLSTSFGNYLKGGYGNRYFWVNSNNGVGSYGYFYGNATSYEPKLQIDYTYYV